jgi:FkbH-like protein
MPRTRVKIYLNMVEFSINTSRIVSALEEKKRDLGCMHLSNTSESVDKWSWSSESERDELLRSEFNALTGYLVNFFSTNDETWCNLYVGEKRKQLHVQGKQGSAARDLRAKVTARDREAYARLLGGALDSTHLEHFLQVLDRMHRVILGGGKTVKVLFVGDCLYLDVMSFLVGPALALGLEIEPSFATSKFPPRLREEVQQFANIKFDLVFVSPFSYDFSIGWAELNGWRRAPLDLKGYRKEVEEHIVRAERMIDDVINTYDCPIYISNTANVQLEETRLKRAVKRLISSLKRREGRGMVDQWLKTFVRRHNARQAGQVRIFDELSLLHARSEDELGRYFYYSDIQHPATLGKYVAREYLDIIFVHTQLVTKKVVVCDLDNTLWDGVIGEGGVTHFKDRQKILQKLKSRGVVLTINSKNAPENIKWDGGLLSEDDFVYSDINWEPKVSGIARTRDTLNLSPKDFVFIDDRADERELVSESFPEMVCLDPTLEETWRRFELWFSCLDSDQETDRTQMYKEREKREAFVGATQGELSDSAELFAKLGLSVEIKNAQEPDLKRVVELINRTNQFNLSASRTTSAEVMGWFKSPSAWIILGVSSDRFGSMGTTCIAVATQANADTIVIEAFVLSCRVFGYGIETAVMNYIKDLARQRGVGQIKAKLVVTDRNQPCHSFLPDNGFERVNEEFVYAGQGDQESPSWLNITRPRYQG